MECEGDESVKRSIAQPEKAGIDFPASLKSL
jgi:hypothetical protein